VIGAQWGDEGKGKITDLLSKSADIVVRYQGVNAGHNCRPGTNVQAAPDSLGILYPDTDRIIGCGPSSTQKF